MRTMFETVLTDCEARRGEFIQVILDPVRSSGIEFTITEKSLTARTFNLFR